MPRDGARREDLNGSADTILESLRQVTGADNPGELLDEEVLRQASRALSDAFDGERGGFGTAPKFPTPHNLLFLPERKPFLPGPVRRKLFEARKAADFVLTSMRDRDGKLLHRYCDGEAAIPAYDEDYAFLIWALIELYEATFDSGYLKSAFAMMDEFIKPYWDDSGGATGGFFQTADDVEALLVRPRSTYDSALPSANLFIGYSSAYR